MAETSKTKPDSENNRLYKKVYAVNIDEAGKMPTHVFGNYPEFRQYLKEGLPKEKRQELLKIYHSNDRPVKPHEVPRIFYLREESDHAHFPDIFRIKNAITVVSDPMAQLIQEFDPDMHQFLPLTIVRPNGEEVGDRFFIFINLARKKTVIEELSTIERANINGQALKGLVESLDTHLTADALNGAHFWREAEFPNNAFISDALYSAINDRGLTFYNVWDCTVLSDEQLANLQGGKAMP